MGAVYPLSRRVAAGQIRLRNSSLTLSATDLAHEAYLRLQDQLAAVWQNREHFFAIAATVVCRIVIDYPGERFADKRAGAKRIVDIDDSNDEALREEGAMIEDGCARTCKAAFCERSGLSLNAFSVNTTSPSALSAWFPIGVMRALTSTAQRVGQLLANVELPSDSLNASRDQKTGAQSNAVANLFRASLAIGVGVGVAALKRFGPSVAAMPKAGLRPRFLPGLPLGWCDFHRRFCPPTMTHVDKPITELLERWRQGDRSAEAGLMEAVYPLLRQVAASQIRQRGNSLTLSATDLAHEAYLRLQDQQAVVWQNREHFFAIAATVVRRVVIDYLRERFADKRAGGKLFVDIDDSNDEALREEGAVIDWIAVDQALNKLHQLDSDCARVVELKLFTPLDAEQIARCCRSSLATVGRQWRFARTWLARELEAASIQDAS